MSWDWDKLKQQQQGRGGGAPPQMDEILDKFKKFKMPGYWKNKKPMLISLFKFFLVKQNIW